MLNVLHLINYPGKGGSERYILSLAEKLHDNKCKFYVAYSEDGPMLRQVRKLGIKTFKIAMKSPYDFKAAWQVKKLCRELSIDIVHTHFLRENYIGVLSKLLGNRVVLVNTGHLLAKKNILVKFTDLLFSAATDEIIAVSKAVRDMLVSQGIRPSKISVIYNGVDLDYWKGERSLKAREDFEIGDQEFVVTSVARFSEEKGHIFLMEAIKQFLKMRKKSDKGFAKKVRFLLVGDGENLEHCKGLAGMMGISDSVIFAGFRKDVRSILHSSDLYVSHSMSEALGISILEAMACGLPVVATNSGGPSEIINAENNCGILVECGDTDGFAAAIHKIVNDTELYNTYRENAIKIVEKEFNLDNTAESTYNLYIKGLKRY